MILLLLILFSGPARASESEVATELLKQQTNGIAETYQQALSAQSEDVFNDGIKALAQKLTQTGLEPDYKMALDHLIETVDGEQWSINDIYHFDLEESLVRNQGVACDGHGHFWYSGTYSLLHASTKTGWSEWTHILPLPFKLIWEEHDDHVGDIDYYNGTIYAPAEDGGNGYKNPYVVLFDANWLYARKYFRLPVEPQKEGVPWVAIEPEKRRAFSSLYYTVNQVNVYDLETFALKDQIQLSSPVLSWQGAKVHNGFLYGTSDADPTTVGKSVVKINLDTGTVIKVATVPTDITELEGLAFSMNGTEPELDTLAMSRQGTNAIERDLTTRAQLDMYTRTQFSLRDQLRKQLGTQN
jgi:hypothetical protein